MKIINKIWNNWHTVILVALCLVPIIWFIGRGDVLITGLDTNFPLDPLVWFQRRFYVWNGINNAGIDFSSSVAGVFFHFVQLAPYLLGLSLKNVEIVSLVFWFSAIVSSSYLLAKTILPKNKTPQLIVVILYILNIYLFNTWENVKVSNLALVTALPLIISIVYNWFSEKINSKKAMIYLCLGSILASGAGINPAYFLVIILALIIETVVYLFLNLSTKTEIKKILVKGLTSFFILILVNIFWIFPLLNFLYSTNTISLVDIGLTNWITSLSQNTSIINVIRLQGAWDWYALDSSGIPQYLSYTLNYLYKFPFIVFSFAVPILVLFSFVFFDKEQKFWYIFFGILTVLGIFFGVGSHPPTGSFFIFLFEHVPFLSFFRSPWYIFTPLLTLSYAALVGLLTYSFFQKYKEGMIKHIFNFLIIIFLIAYGLYNYPLITGKIFRPESKNSFYVYFPEYVWDTKDWLSNKHDSTDERIISYPDDQLESFNWGYQGTESILSLYSNREIITPSFNMTSKVFSEMLGSFYAHIKRGEYKSAISLMEFFGANEIFYKKDSSTLSSPIGDKINDLVETTKFGEWYFMRPKDEMNKKIFIAEAVYKNLSNPEDFIPVIPFLKPKSVVVNNKDTEIGQIKSNERFFSIIKTGILDQDKSILTNVNKYGLDILRNGTFNILIERNYLDRNSLIVKIDSNVISNSLIQYDQSLISVGPVKLFSGTHTIEIVYPVQENLLAISDFENISKNQNLRKEEFPENIQKTLLVYNESKEAQKIILPVNEFNPYLRYAVGFDYKYVYGKVPFVEVLQSAPTSPVKNHSIYPGSSTDWQTRYDIFRPVETNSKLELLIKAGPNEFSGRSKSFIENIFIKRIYDNNVYLVESNSDTSFKYLSKGELKYKKINSVKYEVELKSDGDNQLGSVIAFLDNYNKGWVLKSSDSKIENKFSHFTINGYANGWYVPAGMNTGKFIIYYRPQTLYIFAVLVSVCTIMLLIIYSLHKKKS